MPWVIGAIVAVALTVGVALTHDDTSEAPINADTTNRPMVNTNLSVDADLPDEPAEPTPHPVSIPALMEYKLTGRDLELGPIQSDTSAYTRYTLSYRSDDLTISGILNIPKGDGPFPVLLLNHGYIDTSVYTNGRGLKREQDYLARQGYAVLHSDYRCHAQSDCPAGDALDQRLFYAKDVMNAIQAIRTSGDSRLSTTAFGMLGHSMGGGITQVIATAKPDLIDAAVLYAPVSSSYLDSYRRYTERRPQQAAEVIERYGSHETNPEFWNNLSPRTFFDRVQIPLLYVHGTSDADVPIAWSDTSVELLQRAGKSVEYLKLPGQPHEFGGASWTRFMEQSTDFFNRWIQR